MPKHRERRRRDKFRRSELDWFAEDPWAEPDLDAMEHDEEDVWYPGLWEPDDEELQSEDVDIYSPSDPYDGWGPVRRRHV